MPDAYQEVDYIQSSGTQYIDTGVSANQYLSYEAELTALGTTNDSPLFGARTGSTSNRFGLIVYGGNFHMMIGSTSAESFNNTPVDTNKHTCSVFVNNGSYTATIDGNTSTGSTSTAAYVNQNFWLFKYNYGSVAPCPMKLYYFKLYTGSSTLVRDFVPCYRKSDSVIGMYDLVNDQFYTNAGSGTFTKGTDSSTLVYKEFQVWPDDQWQLRDETDMANSTTGSSGVIASTNGKFIRPSYSFGGGNGAYSKGTIDGYDVLVASSSHGNVHIGLSDANYTDLMSHKKVKIVWDYFNLGANQSNYTNGIWFGGNESLTDTSSSSTITVGSNWSGMSFSYSTGYSMEQIINTSDMSCTTTITNLSNQAKSTFTYTKVFSRETNSTYIINGGGNRFIWMNDDYGGGPVRAGNIHVYYTD